MSWGDIWKIIFAALASVGGVAGLIILVVKFASNIIAERLSQKYQISLEKELESHKSKLDSKNYISKARFDREFAMYQELSEKHMTMVYDIGAAVMITRGAKVPECEKDSDFVELALVHINEAELLNKRYAPFISKDIFEKYKELGQKSFGVISMLNGWIISRETKAGVIFNGKTYTEGMAKEEIENRQKEVSKMSDEILDTLRDYLSTIEKVEE